MNLKRLVPNLFFILLPLIYLAYLWGDLPNEVPYHWNTEGQVDSYGSKYLLIFIPGLLPAFAYVVFLLSLRLDPIKKLNPSNKKLQMMKFSMVLIFSLLALYILYAMQSKDLFDPKIILSIIGILYLVMGNYFQTLKRNYFIGIKTPWTLQSDEIWKKTHIFGGRLWFIGGVLVILFSFVTSSSINLILFFSITGIITILPIAYSYLLFKKQQSIESEV